MLDGAMIYTRINGQLGASCDGVADAGYHITIRGVRGVGLFTVYDPDDPDQAIAVDVSRKEAEAAIARNWRNASDRT